MSAGDAPAAVPAPIARLKDELAALERAYSPGHHGLWSARRRAELVDAALVDLYAAATSAGDRAPRTALVALGGYGRGALCPRSDIDIVLLHDGAESAAVAALTQQLLYPLWDAGFTVGHAVRTPGESVELATERLDAATAMLDARLLAGDADLLGEASGPVLARLRGDVDGFAESLANDARDRRKRFGSAAYLLEPELKEGGGGLRDIHAFGWLQEVRGRPLEDDGLLRAAERDRLEAAEEFLTRVRSAMHLESGRRTDRLLREQQHDIAKVMGFQDEPRLIAEDGLMRTVFEHARVVDALTEDVIVHGRPSGGSSDQVELLHAADALALIADAAEEGRSLSAAELDAVEVIASPDELEWGDAVRDAFLRILGAGPGATDGLQALDRTGLLARLIPEWVDVRCRPQRDPYHRYTVDVHLLRAFDRMSRALAAARRGRSAGGRGGRSHRGTGRRAPRGAPARHRQERGGRARAGRRPGRGHDPRPHGCRGVDGRARSIHGGRAPAPARHRHQTRSGRRRPDPGRRRAGRDARTARGAVPAREGRRARHRARRRGRRGARR